MSSELQCYNTSCGQMYRSEENHDQACQHHPGKPYFHDGYKEWTCCKMRSRDFSVFIGFKGCTKGRHSNVKPEELPKQYEPPSIECLSDENSHLVYEKNQKETLPPQSQFISPDPNLEETIPIVESLSLISTPPPPRSIKICKNCKKEESTLNMKGPCLYHNGVQIFHDTYKFWSCCQHKKFSDFDDFQKLVPCSRSEQHELIVKIEYKENWFQTGGTLTIALYGLKGARNTNDGKSKVLLRGGRRLYSHLVNQEGLTIFEKEWILRDYVLGAPYSKVTINPSNVQIILKKLNEKFHWPSLEQDKQQSKP